MNFKDSLPPNLLELPELAATDVEQVINSPTSQGQVILIDTNGPLAKYYRMSLAAFLAAGLTSVTVAKPTAAIGYATGSGGAVAQATSKSTGVTLNTPAGKITMNNAALAAGAAVAFTLTNSKIGANDVPNVAIKSGGTSGAYGLSVTAVAAGSCEITVRNLTGGSLGEALVLNFAIIKGAEA